MDNTKLRGKDSTQNLAIQLFKGVTKRLTYKEVLARIQEVCPESGLGRYRHVHLMKSGFISRDENGTYGPTFNPENPDGVAAAAKRELAKRRIEPMPSITHVNTTHDIFQRLKSGKATAILLHRDASGRVLVNDKAWVTIKSSLMVVFYDKSGRVFSVTSGSQHSRSRTERLTNALGFESPEDFRASMESGLQPCWPYVGYICEVSKETT